MLSIIILPVNVHNSYEMIFDFIASTVGSRYYVLVIKYELDYGKNHYFVTIS